MKALLRSATRELDLLKRMPKSLQETRHGDLDDRCHIAIAACCVKLNCAKTRFTVPRMTDDPPCWAAITGERTSAGAIVEALELTDMLKAPVIVQGRRD